jgi:hypothetical protein
MPNAQTHLVSACDLIARPAVLNAFPALAEDIVQSAFLLGSISPDVRALSGHRREETHFFDIPLSDPEPADQHLFAAYPELADSAALPAEQAAFIAGYVTHLVMDETWLKIVVMPGLFIEGAVWGTHHPNWWVYSLLMTYLEYRAADRLCDTALPGLKAAAPNHWLPFVTDRDLARWRDHVAEMISGGGARLISAMFAHTNGISPEELEAIVLDNDRMQQEAFQTVSPGQIDTFQAATDRRSEAAILAYFTHS